MHSRRSSRRPRRHLSRPIRLEPLESRRLLAANALAMGLTPLNTGEVLLGSVAVTPVLFESDGTLDTESQDWTGQEIQDTLAKVDEGVNWWTRALGHLHTVHTLEFVIDDSFAVDPVETGYEPIDHSSQVFEEYVGAFLTARGYGDAPSIERAVQLFNHDQRIKLGTDWAFTIFIIDASDDPDGLFTSGGQFSGAFAYPGGLFIVTPSTRPASTIAHEMGHIFWARDEYAGAASYTDRRGYYNAPVLNAADNPDPNFVHENSIMRGGVPLTAAYQSETSPASTFALVGWRDSDGDGVFDFADVPLDLEAVGYFDAETSQYLVSGVASAVPLKNENSSGVQSDITLNRVSELQYRLDAGPWLAAASPDQQVVEFDLAIPITSDFATIEFRAIDQNIGISSQIISGTSTTPALSAASIAGYAFVDDNDNGIRDPGEALMSDAQVVLRQSDGNPLLGGSYAATDFDIGEIQVPTPGLQLSAKGLLMATKVASLDSLDAGNKRVFQGFNTHTDEWLDRWSDRSILVAEFDEDIGEVDVTVTGLDDGSYARLRAFDASGHLIKRMTSDWIAGGHNQLISIDDPAGRIARVEVLGHAETFIAISDIRFGSIDAVVTDASGAFHFANLSDGEYRIDWTADRLIHRFDQSSTQVSVSGGGSEVIVGAAVRVTSPRHNTLIAEDVSGEGHVTSRDALLVINDLARSGARILGPNELGGDWIDVNDDGMATALDALLVINSLRQKELESEQVPEQVPAQSRAAATDAALRTWTNAPITSPALLASDPRMFKSAGESPQHESSSLGVSDIELGVPGDSLWKRRESWENSAEIVKTGENRLVQAVPNLATIDRNAAEKLEPLIQTEV